MANSFTISNSEKKYGYYTSSTLDGGTGNFAPSPNLCHIIIPISEFCGYSISVDYSAQYGFISEYKDGQYIKYCNNCNRVNGTPQDIQIPYDCEYLYLFIGENADDRIITINDFPSSSFQSINSSIISLNTSYQNLSDELDNVSSEVSNLDKRLYGGEEPVSANVSSSGEINFTPIVLSEDDDELELFVRPDSSMTSQNLGGYSFSKAFSSITVALGIYYGGIGLRADDQTWLFGPSLVIDTSKVIKIKYVSGNIELYEADVLKSTYTGQKTVTLYGLGEQNNSYGKWHGLINKFNYTHDGITTSLFDLPGFSHNEGVEITNIPINGDVQNLQNSVTTLNEEIDSILGEVSYKYTFNGTDTKADLTTPITLHKNGDYIKFKILSCESDVPDNKFYGFSHGTTDTSVAIAFSSIPSCSIRATDSTWIASGVHANFIEHEFKIAYEDSKINVYVDENIVHTYNGQKDVVIGGFGYNKTYGYWTGSISDIEVNGEPYIISEHSLNSTIIQESSRGSILSKEEKTEIWSTALFEKTASQANFYYKISNGNYIKVPFKHRYSAFTEGAYPSFLDNWGIYVLQECEFANGSMLQTHTLFQGGEAELAIRCTDGVNNSIFSYVGGAAHGFENISSTENVRDIVMLLNGNRIAENSVISLQPVEKFEVFAKSLLYQAYTNTNPFAEVVKHWVFIDNKISITTSVKLLRSIEFTNAMFGMFCINRHLDADNTKPYIAGRAIKNNNQFIEYNVEDSWWQISPMPAIGKFDHDCSKISVFGDAQFGASMEILDATLKQHGGMAIGTNAGLAYNKIYFDLTGAYTPSSGEELKATQVWYLNKII